MDRIIKIGTHEVGMRASARTPRLYRGMTGKDMFRDIAVMRSEYAKEGTVNAEIIENVAWVMAKQYAPDDVPANIDEWLDGFGVFDVADATNEIVGLWLENTATTSEPKKKVEQQ